MTECLQSGHHGRLPSLYRRQLPHSTLPAGLPVESRRAAQHAAACTARSQQLRPEKAIFIFVSSVLPPSAALMSSIYEEHRDEDGFLYIQYSGEHTFGAAGAAADGDLELLQ